MQKRVTEIYGINSFNDGVMRERLPKSIYREMTAVQNGEKELTLETAEVVAGTMKDWAIERGATHFTHWFQPLNGLTAEKHDSFISPTPEGKVIMEFSGKELIKGEPDASSFPSGGLRVTFEARGYTAWDTTSPAFLRQDRAGNTLCIPTAFVSYRGEALDKKVPLLRSMEALNRQSLRILRVLGNTTTKRVFPTVGPEQEYFLVDRKFFDLRSDLLLTGRTLFGSPPAKGQEMEDHYYGAIKERVIEFMGELNQELWKMGVSAKTQHNEVAPNQFELATIFETANVAGDSNQLVMETLRRVALHHDMVVLLHEKPFAGVNGSGKHNNWSLSTDDGINLLEPGTDPHENAQFLLFLSAVLAAVDTYAPLLRMSAATPGNDHRLGANEAPPAVISIFLGQQLTDILDRLSRGEPETVKNGERMETGVFTLPRFPKDLTDRNRTSPFAFTGNKFEFRMVGSSQSIGKANTLLNTAVAEILSRFAERLEGMPDPEAAELEAKKIILETYRDHRRIIFNGNGYSGEWLKEAEERGLPNLANTVDAVPVLLSPESVDLFTRHKVLSREELESRTAIYLENYSKQIHIEANVMIRMVRREIYPASAAYAEKLAKTINAIGSVDSNMPYRSLKANLKTILLEMESLQKHMEDLDALVEKGLGQDTDHLSKAKFYRDQVFPAMQSLRVHGDALERLLPKKLWPFPTYEDLLFRL